MCLNPLVSVLLLLHILQGLQVLPKCSCTIYSTMAPPSKARYQVMVPCWAPLLGLPPSTSLIIRALCTSTLPFCLLLHGTLNPKISKSSKAFQVTHMSVLGQNFPISLLFCFSPPSSQHYGREGKVFLNSLKIILSRYYPLFNILMWCANWLP